MKNTSDLLNAVQKYFDALYHCDTELLNDIFHSSSSLFDADEGKLVVDPIESFSKAVASRPSPASQKQARDDEEILMIDYLSPISATVKIRIRALQFVFVDHLGFVKTENGWKIVSKIWHLEKVIEAT